MNWLRARTALLARVVYSGELTASEYSARRLAASNQDAERQRNHHRYLLLYDGHRPAHPSNYTRGGLEVFFRPNADARASGALHAKTAGFFRAGELYPGEDELRRDAHKWETCLHAMVTKRGSGLNGPVFDIHYNARAEGQNDRSSNKIPYALVITVEAPSTKDLYDQVVRRYRPNSRTAHAGNSNSSANLTNNRVH